MNEYFVGELGVSENLFYYVILPILIFLARIADVSINTVRIIFVMGGRKVISTILGFFESLIWLLAIGQIFRNIDNWVSYIAYPLGFATGILVGMVIEEKLALGKVVVRVITTKDVSSLLAFLKSNGMRYSVIEAHSDSGKENIIFSVIKRAEIKHFQQGIAHYLPTAFYTIESVKQAREAGRLHESGSMKKEESWMRSVKRK